MSNNNINSETKNDDEILFVDEKSSVKNIDQNTAWKIMIVDDKEEIHNVTRLVLNDVTFKGQNLEFINAY